MTPTEAPDAMEILADTARRQALEEAVAERIGKARRTLIFGKSADHAFWATLALKLELKTDWSIPTLCTNGKVLKVNPEYLASHSDAKVVGLQAHEVMHNAQQHFARLGNREPRLANIAMDLAINQLLLDAGFELPEGGCFPSDPEPFRFGGGALTFKDIPKDVSFEKAYALLQDQMADQNGDKGDDGEEGEEGDGDADGEGDGKGQGKGQGNDPGGCGGVEKAGDGSESAQRQAQGEWEVAVAQAAQVAKQRGALSAGLARLVDQVLNPRVDWRAALADFVTKHCKTDFRWSPPNRRFAWQGLYLPSLGGDALGDVVAAVDTSGSIGDKELSRFAAELQGILASYDDVTLTILYHDSEVCHVQKWTPSDGPLVLEPKGGGGTDHQPVFRWVQEHETEPTCMVCLTDLCSTFPAQAPDYPVLWATTVPGSKGPWGRTIEVLD